MKKLRKIFTLLTFVLIVSTGIAQGPPDPDPDPTGGGDHIGGGASIDSGVLIFIILGSVYAYRKTETRYKRNLDDLQRF